MLTSAVIPLRVKLLFLCTASGLFILLDKYSLLTGPTFARIGAIILFSFLGAVIGLFIFYTATTSWSGRAILLAVPILFFVLLTNNRHFAKVALPVTAHITSGHGVTSSSGRGSSDVEYTIEFKTEAGEQVATTFVSRPILDPNSSSINILYDSTNPQRVHAASATSRPIWPDPLFGTLGLTFLGLVLNLYIVSRSMKR
jgi:hypothetical protein